MLRLITFGGLSLVDDGAPVTGAASQRSRLALLAILAAAGPAGVSRDKLLASLWPESENERARHALKQAVYALRRDLGNENAIVGTATLTLDPTVVSSDLREFEDALSRGDDASAVSVYAGPFLDGVFVKGAAEFDQWAGGERTRLERAYLEALERLAKAADSQDDLAAAVQWWRRAAAAEPLSGRYALLLMRALADAGDVSSAIQHARVHDAVVRAQLDSGADDAVLAFAEELKRGDWKPAPRAPRAARVTTAESRPVADTPAPLPAEPIFEQTPTEAATATTTPRRRLKRWWLAAAAVGAMVLVWLGTALTRNEMPTILGPTPAPKSVRRIVVAGFSNLTGDHKLDPAGDMAADFIVQRLVDASFEVVDTRTTALAAHSVFSTTKLTSARDSASALAAETGASQVISGKYYKQGDTLLIQANVVDAGKGITMHSVGPFSGSASDVRGIVAKLANGISVAMAASADSTPGASTAALITPPSVEAYVHVSRAWEMFFTRPADTTAVFEELRRALSTDTAYTTPRLMRAYILDVKERWADLALELKQLVSRRSRMDRVELAAVALYDADLRGDLVGRLNASHDLQRLNPGSVDMALLVAVSASYLHRFNEVLRVLRASNPELGINAVTPMYWAWRAEAEHNLGKFDQELLSAGELLKRFPGELYGAQAKARALAALGDTAKLRAHLASVGYGARTLTLDARKVGMLAARELRAHGHSSSAPPMFAQMASVPPATSAPEERELHALALYESGNYAAAKAELSALFAANPNDLDSFGRLGAIAVRTGDSTAARQIDGRLAAWSQPYSFGRPSYWRAHLAALSGRPGEAVTLLHEALAKGYRPMDLNIITVHEEPDFMSLWGDAGFKALLVRDGQTTVSP